MKIPLLIPTHNCIEILTVCEFAFNSEIKKPA